MFSSHCGVRITLISLKAQDKQTTFITPYQAHIYFEKEYWAPDTEESAPDSQLPKFNIANYHILGCAILVFDPGYNLDRVVEKNKNKK